MPTDKKTHFIISSLKPSPLKWHPDKLFLNMGPQIHKYEMQKHEFLNDLFETCGLGYIIHVSC
jgi:hypothetical protein